MRLSDNIFNFLMKMAVVPLLWRSLRKLSAGFDPEHQTGTAIVGDVGTLGFLGKNIV
jgi:hypothetical protein